MYFPYKNTSIHFKIKGEGAPVLLLHGFLESGDIWKNIHQHLGEDYMFIIPDLLGHGKSGLTGTFLSMEEQAEAMAGLCQYLGINEFAVAGHSMGGYISLALAEMYPEKLSGLMLFHSHPFADDDVKKKARDLAVSKVKKDKTTFIEQSIPGFFAPGNQEKFQNEIKKLIRKARKMPVEGISGALRGMKIRKDRSELFFSKTNYIKWWVLGEKDPLVNAPAWYKQYQKNPHVQIHMLPDGHMGFIENKKEVTALFKTFLNQIYSV